MQDSSLVITATADVLADKASAGTVLTTKLDMFSYFRFFFDFSFGDLMTSLKMADEICHIKTTAPI